MSERGRHNGREGPNLGPIHPQPQPEPQPLLIDRSDIIIFEEPLRIDDMATEMDEQPLRIVEPMDEPAVRFEQPDEQAELLNDLRSLRTARENAIVQNIE